MTPKKRRRILVANNDQTFLDLLAERVLKMEMNVDFAEDGREALLLIEEEDYDLIVLDIALPIHNGLEILSFAKQQRPDLPVLIVTYSGTQDWAEQAIRGGAYAYLLRPLEDISEFDRALTQGLGMSNSSAADESSTPNFYSSVMGSAKNGDDDATGLEPTIKSPEKDLPLPSSVPASSSPMKVLAKKGAKLQKNRQEQLVQVLDSLPDGVIELDQQGQILTINPTAREWLSLESITSEKPITDFLTNIPSTPKRDNINIRMLGRNARLTVKPLHSNDGTQRTVIVIRDTGNDDEPVQRPSDKTNQRATIGANGETKFSNVTRIPLPESYEEGWSILTMVDQLKELVQTETTRFLENNPFQFVKDLLNPEEEEEELDPEVFTSMSQRLTDINGRR